MKKGGEEGRLAKIIESFVSDLSTTVYFKTELEKPMQKKKITFECHIHAQIDSYLL